MQMLEISTPDKLVYHFFPNNTGLFRFKVRASKCVYVALTKTAAETKPMYEIVIGGWKNEGSVIVKNRDHPGGNLKYVKTPQILSSDLLRGFWIRWDNNGLLCAGKELQDLPFIYYIDKEKVHLNFVGICTCLGATGDWVIYQPMPVGKTTWIAAANGAVPSGAFQAGEENGEPVFVIRANIEKENVCPGKLLPSRRTSIVGWSTTEHTVDQYEVLCNFKGKWEKCEGNAIPDNALVAGHGNTGESIYVGRALHNGSMYLSKVHPTRGCFLYPDGKEEKHKDYEILVHSPKI